MELAAFRLRSRSSRRVTQKTGKKGRNCRDFSLGYCCPFHRDVGIFSARSAEKSERQSHQAPLVTSSVSRVDWLVPSERHLTHFAATSYTHALQFHSDLIALSIGPVCGWEDLHVATDRRWIGN